ncbi:hypothetical protein CLV51_11185 [Chitinophaga niastensis]|uniref:Collagen triple helix repeat protein n=1 Tax=Chitinophaga niastensis TaxID=536980 RepID=A0A2P8H949_CHINA|nr:hypothetical protein [Chitinophaga niastensis]PSL42699.1 hypothetical protein CLV51_11185 [Chitinophaga niastensis]
MKRIIFLVVCAATVMLAGAGCKKGDTGPKGDTGQQGAQGPVGTPNVIYSSWFTPSLYIKDTVFGIWGLNYNKAAASITQQVLDSGTVLTFGKLEGYNSIIWPKGQVAQLPITVTYIIGPTQNDTWSALATVGNLHIRFVNDHNLYGNISTTHQFRYIIIPGGKPGARVAQLSYEEICRQYNIPE